MISERLREGHALRANVYFAIAHWIWGYSEDQMQYGPPNRGIPDRLAMWVYNRGIRIQNELNGCCPRCGKP